MGDGQQGLGPALANGLGQAQQPAQVPCLLVPVSPQIQIRAPQLVLVRKPYQVQANERPHRIAVTLRASRRFVGQGELTHNAGGGIVVYNAAENGLLLAMPYTVPGATLARGVTVYVQAATASAAMNDTVLTLNLNTAEPRLNNPVTDQMTRIELHLDLCGYKPVTGGADPAPLGGELRVDPGRNLHVQTEQRIAGRLLMIVRRTTPNDYPGSVILKRTNNRVRPYAYAQEVPPQRPNPPDAKQPSPLTTLNTTISLVTGLRLWVEGRRTSGALRDTGFTLEISDLPRREGDRANITVIKAVVDVAQSRPRNGGEPAMMRRKLDPGRFLHLQDAGNRYSRAKVVLRRAEPDVFRGQLDLLVWDTAVPANNAANPRIALYPVEDPTAGGAAAPNPHPVTQTNAVPPAAGTADLWAQGALVSSALRDTALRLKVSDAEGFADKVAFTVASFTRIDATIQPTPAHTPGRSPVPAVHTYQVNSLDPDFAVNLPLVLMRNAQPNVALVLTAAPANLPLRWEAVRNPNDHASLGGAGAVPTVTAGAFTAPNQYAATLNTNEKGSFRIRPYIDCNSDDRYSNGEPSMPLNLVLADVKRVRDNSVGLNTNLTSTINAGGVSIGNGVWNAGLPGSGMSMELVADVTGGGADGRLGMTEVFGGLINMQTAVDVRARYVAPPATIYTVTNINASNLAAATGAFSGTPMFRPGGPAPVIVAMPILDSGRNAPGMAGLGGETAVMGRSGPTDAVANLAVGQRRTLQCFDSPGDPFPSSHPDHPLAVLTRIDYRLGFKAAFCFWTSLTGARGASMAATPADRLYSTVRVMDWTITGGWTVDYAPLVPTLARLARHRVSVSNRSSYTPPSRAQDRGIEVRGPSGIVDAFAFQTT
jgi:hypothetical protein